MKIQPLTRREFIKNTSMATMSTSLLMNLSPTLASEPAKNSTVVLIRNKNVIDKKGMQQKKVTQDMLDTAVMNLVQVNDPIKAWQKIIKPEDIVGIKSNVWYYLPTGKEMEQVIEDRLLTLGVARKNISVNDRGVLKDKVFNQATALINVRPMRTHHWSGVGSLIKNYIMFVPNPQDYHNDYCADLATLWHLPQVRNKTRLNILSMVTPQFHSTGPHSFNPKYVWNYYGILVGFDPVALDATGIRIIQAKRKDFFQNDRPINPPPKHVTLADTRHHLGISDQRKINLIKIGYKDGILI